MIYTIMHAISVKNVLHVELTKNGNMFVVSAWDGNGFRTIERREFSRYDDAEAAFQAMCKQYNMTIINEVEQTWDATDFD